MANIGYIRVSAGDQSLTLQEDALKTFNLDKVFQDRVSGRKFECPELDALMESIHSGDTLYIYRLDRLGKSLRDLLRVCARLNSMGVKLVSVSDHIDTSTDTGRFVMNIFGTLAEYERELIIERTNAGIRVAKECGKKFGAPTMTAKREERIRKTEELWNKGVSADEIGRVIGVDRSTVYNYLKRIKQQKKNLQ